MQKNFTVVTFTTKYTYYYHAFHWDISLRRSVPHSSIIAFLPFFCYHHLIRAQMLSLALKWKNSVASPRMIQDLSKTTSCSKLHFGLFSFIRQTEYQLGTARLRGPHSRNTRRFWHRLLRRWRLNAATGGPPSRDTSYDRPNQKSPKKTREEPSSVDGEKGTDSSDEISGTVLNRQGCLHFEYLITETYQV